MMVVAGERFVNMGDLMHCENPVEVEWQVLQLVYSNLSELNGKMFKSGQSKIRVIQQYSRVRGMIAKEGGVSFGEWGQQSATKEKHLPVTPQKSKPLSSKSIDKPIRTII